MKIIKSISLMLAAIFVLGACSTSNNVVSNRMIQKRKYNKGFHINKKQNFRTTSASDVEGVKNSNSKDVVNDDTRLANRKIDLISEESKVSRKLARSNFENKEEQKRDVSSNEAENKVNARYAQLEDKLRVANNTPRKQAKKESKKKSAPASDANTILLVILAIFIPPLAVFLFEGASTRFWIDLILALLGWGLLAWLLPGFFYIGGLIAVIYALLIVLRVI